MSDQIILAREELDTLSIDIGGRDVIIGYNEPALRYSHHSLSEPNLDAKLSARLPVYFLSTVEIARKQKHRPRLLLTSGINMAMKRSATTDTQRAIMLADNMIKRDFLGQFFEHFFYDDFSIVEDIIADDVFKIPEEKLMLLRKMMKKKDPEATLAITIQLAKFKKPSLFNRVDEKTKKEDLSIEAREYIDQENEELQNAFKYALSHTFALGDANFDGEYNNHNMVGYAAIGGHQEKAFNKVRELACDIIKDLGQLIFQKSIIMKDNLKIIIEGPKVPPSYNGYRKSTGGGRKVIYDEVTYENNLPISYYETHPKLHQDIAYIYKLIDKEAYQSFRDSYRSRYFDLKARYKEAYRLPDYR